MTEDNTFTGAIYTPPQQGLPYIVAIFKHGGFVASKVVETLPEAESELALALTELPKFPEDAPHA